MWIRNIFVRMDRFYSLNAISYKLFIEPPSYQLIASLRELPREKPLAMSSISHQGHEESTEMNRRDNLIKERSAGTSDCSPTTSYFPSSPSIIARTVRNFIGKVMQFF